MYEEKCEYFRGLCLYLRDADSELYEECLSTPRGTWQDSNGVVKSVYKHDVVRNGFSSSTQPPELSSLS
jgi:hypothetical protein